MKIIPSNQTLILASERGTSSGPPTTASPRALYAGSESVLKRVTVVATRPDDTLVYLQADYSPAAESSSYAAPAISAQTAPNVVAAPARLPVRIPPEAYSGGPYRSSRGIELYASTQRMLAAAPMTQIDVRA